MNPRILAILSCASLILLGCATDKKPEEKKKPIEAPKLVGLVMSKPSKKNFVLIEYYGTWKYEDGTELQSSGAGRNACLIVSGEKLGPYLAADVESGAVDVGDAVYYSPTKPEAEETDLVDPVNPAENSATAVPPAPPAQ
jgi:hypothetical protein